MTTQITQDQSRIGACAILRNASGQILVGKRKNSYKAGFFGLPGGRVELHEPLLQAIKREVKEETNLDFEEYTYVGVVRESQEGYDFIHFVYLVDGVTAQPELCEPEKCVGWEWFEPTEISPFLPGHQAAVALLGQSIPIIDVL